MGFYYLFEYKKDTKNLAMDALSRRNEVSREPNHCKAISMVLTITVPTVKEMNRSANFLKELRQKLEVGIRPSYCFQGIGVWFYKGHIQLDHVHLSLSRSPSSTRRRPFRVPPTLHWIKHTFWWSGMKKTIKKAIHGCDTCQRNKGENIAMPVLLEPLLVPLHV